MKSSVNTTPPRALSDTPFLLVLWCVGQGIPLVAEGSRWKAGSPIHGQTRPVACLEMVSE